MDDHETEGFPTDDGDSFKVIIIGDANVGKTSLLLRFIENKFTPTTTSIGYISDRKKLITVNGKEVNLHVWDTAGQERFMSITNRYYRDTQAVVIVYDCCAEESFYNVDKWYTEVNTYLAPQLDDGMPIVLAANKKDKMAEMATTGDVVNVKVAQELASSKGFLACVETSAKTGDGVNRLFETIAKELLRQNGPKSTGRVDKVQKKGGNCCGSS